MCTTYVAKEIPGSSDYILDTHLIEYTWQAFNHSSNLMIHYFAQPNDVEIIIKIFNGLGSYLRYIAWHLAPIESIKSKEQLYVIDQYRSGFTRNYHPSLYQDI